MFLAPFSPVNTGIIQFATNQNIQTSFNRDAYPEYVYQSSACGPDSRGAGAEGQRVLGEKAD